MNTQNATDDYRPEAPSFECHVPIEEETARGNIKQISLQNNKIQLNISDYRTRGPFVQETEFYETAFGFRFCLSGTTRFRIDCLKDDLRLKPGRSHMFLFPEIKGFQDSNPSDHICKIVILVEPSFLASVMEEGRQEIPSWLKKTLEHDSRRPFNLEDRITPAMHTALEQIMCCPYEGATRRFFLESKVLELIAYKLDQMKPARRGTMQRSALQKGDEERIRHAAELLVKNMQSPPCIDDLSRSIGMSRTKLIKSFPRVFGTSPYEYLRRMRLERAGKLLSKGEMNITETAYWVGYSSSSHFTKAFREYYGMLPSRYLAG